MENLLLKSTTVIPYRGGGCWRCSLPPRRRLWACCRIDASFYNDQNRWLFTITKLLNRRNFRNSDNWHDFWILVLFCLSFGVDMQKENLCPACARRVLNAHQEQPTRAQQIPKACQQARPLGTGHSRGVFQLRNKLKAWAVGKNPEETSWMVNNEKDNYKLNW